jgi:putative transposase
MDTGIIQNTPFLKTGWLMGFRSEAVVYYVCFKGQKAMSAIFLSPRDYSYFLRLIRKYKKIHQVRIFAFCLLPNSVHLILHAITAEQLIVFLLQIRASYRSYSSARFGVSGHRFRRPRLRVIQEDAHLIECIKSLEFKPVFAEMTQNPIRYPWSSCSYRVLGREGDLVDQHLVGSGSRLA